MTVFCLACSVYLLANCTLWTIHCILNWSPLTQSHVIKPLSLKYCPYIRGIITALHLSHRLINGLVSLFSFTNSLILLPPSNVLILGRLFRGVNHSAEISYTSTRNPIVFIWTPIVLSEISYIFETSDFPLGLFNSRLAKLLSLASWDEGFMEGAENCFNDVGHYHTKILKTQNKLSAGGWEWGRIWVIPALGDAPKAPSPKKSVPKRRRIIC